MAYMAHSIEHTVNSDLSHSLNHSFYNSDFFYSTIRIPLIDSIFTATNMSKTLNLTTSLPLDPLFILMQADFTLLLV